MDTSDSQIRRSAQRWLTLVVAPVAISLAAIDVTNLSAGQATAPWLWLVTTIAIVLAILLYVIGYTRSFEDRVTSIEQRFRSQRFRKPHVLILDGTIDGGLSQTAPVPVWSERIPSDWKSALATFGWQVEIGPIQRMLRDHAPDLVVNPFGEVYPEADFISNSTISELRDYVWSGGVLVNVAGLPFWYRYSPTRAVRENAGRAKIISEKEVLWIPLFSDLFPNLTTGTEPQDVVCAQTQDDIKRFGNIVGAGGKPTIRSYRAHPLQPAMLLPILRDKDQALCIIGAYLYGRGCFLLSGTHLQADDVASFEKVTAAIKGWADYEARGRKP